MTIECSLASLNVLADATFEVSLGSFNVLADATFEVSLGSFNVFAQIPIAPTGIRIRAVQVIG